MEETAKYRKNIKAVRTCDGGFPWRSLCPSWLLSVICEKRRSVGTNGGPPSLNCGKCLGCFRTTNKKESSMKVMRAGLLVSVLLGLMTWPAAAKPVEDAGKVTAVTVYRGQALVTRTI